MSATPRPWTVELDNEIDLHVIAGADRDGSIGAVYDSAEDAHLIVRAVNAFDALLAVAKAAAAEAEGGSYEPAEEALDRLDAAYPEWRTW
jgi:hypothetical protein